jgi:hypothetical protein
MMMMMMMMVVVVVVIAMIMMTMTFCNAKRNVFPYLSLDMLYSGNPCSRKRTTEY